MAQTLTATLQTNMGPVVVRLLPDHAPKTVRNFTDLAEGRRRGLPQIRVAGCELFDDRLHGAAVLKLS